MPAVSAGAKVESVSSYDRGTPRRPTQKHCPDGPAIVASRHRFWAACRTTDGRRHGALCSPCTRRTRVVWCCAESNCRPRPIFG